jgi:signal transduction histidine kinase
MLAARQYLLQRTIRSAADQIKEREKHPESNRQLKSISMDRNIEELLKKINEIYQARQQERIIYERRETQIRREIENISHDLRTPLTSIIGYVELIRDPQTKEYERKEYLQIIQKRAKLLQGFIQNFYELSRIEGDDYPLLLDLVQVQSSLSEVVVAYYREFEKRQLEVTVSLEDKPCFIIADKIQFNRILNNLIQNVLKYAQNRFILKQFTKDGECILQFHNDKDQMKETELKLIFDRFYTGDLARSNQSTGLGLTIVKILTEKMKGHVDAKLEGDLFIIEVRFKAQ